MSEKLRRGGRPGLATLGRVTWPQSGAAGAVNLELRRRIYLAVGVVGLLTCTGRTLFGSGPAWEQRVTYPLLAGYLAVAVVLLIRTPRAVPVVERTGYWVVLIGWLSTMAANLTTIADDEAAWNTLSPTIFMNLALLVVLGYLWFDTQAALLASLVGPIASIAIGLIRWWDETEYAVRLLQVEGYVLVIAAFVYLLARSKDSLASIRVEAAQMRTLAYQDALTGLANRRSAADHLGRLMADPQTAHEVCVVSFDLDHFKVINDTHGHDGGDQILREVADLFRSHVPSGGTSARWGGEEFLAVLPWCRLTDAEELADGLRRALEDRSTAEIPLTASFGVTQVQRGQTLDEVLRNVDKLLYAAKAAGRNTVVVATPVRESLVRDDSVQA